MTKKMTLSEELQWRGFVNQTTLNDITDLDSQKYSFYWGVDPSAPSMTIGNLAAAMLVRRFIEHGHKPYLLVGGATGMIGDPDGKKQERELHSLEEVEDYKQGIISEYHRVFDGMEFEVVDNLDWFKDIKYLDFLRNIGKHLSMTQLIDREFVKSRIGAGGAGISYAEFSYSLIQGYDFLHLFREHGVSLQLCGADQWGNSLAGVEMIRKLEAQSAHVFSSPLVVNQATGKKFGKTEDGAVWLNPELTSPYDFYQFWLNVDDDGVADYLKIYTLIERDELDSLLAEFESAPQLRAAQKYLAYEVTKLVHGSAEADAVRAASEILFNDRDFATATAKEVAVLEGVIPLVDHAELIDNLVAAELASSKSEARRFMEQGAITVNSQPVTVDSQIDQFKPVHGRCLLRRGKNSFALIKC